MSYSSHETQENAGPADGLSHVEPDEVGVGLLATIGAMVAVAVLLVIVLLQAWFYNWSRDALAGWRTSDTVPAPLAQATEEQQAQIGGYHWVDRQTHTRAIPIEAAMKIEARELAAQQAPAAEEQEGK